MNTAVGYIRVSTDSEQQANSLAAQPETIRAYARMQGLDLLEIVQDETSALKVPFFDRPGGKRIYDLIREGKVHHVIGAKVDRIFRNAKDGLDTADWMRKKGVDLHVIDTGGILNVGDAAGRLMFTMLLGVAEFEPRRISQRTKEALAVMRQNGKKTGAIPLGKREENGVMVDVPDELDVVMEIRDRVEKGEKLSAIAKDLNGRAVPTKKGGTWHASTIRAIVRRVS